MKNKKEIDKDITKRVLNFVEEKNIDIQQIAKLMGVSRENFYTKLRHIRQGKDTFFTISQYHFLLHNYKKILLAKGKLLREFSNILNRKKRKIGDITISRQLFEDFTHRYGISKRYISFLSGINYAKLRQAHRKIYVDELLYLSYLLAEILKKELIFVKAELTDISYKL